MRSLLMITFLCLSCIPFNLSAQCEGSIELSTQAEVDAWASCTFFDGDINISGNNITNLTALTGLEHVSGYFAITYCPLLTDLTGLEELRYIGQQLVIIENDLLSDLTALNNLTAINSLQLDNCNALQSLSGLDNIANEPDFVYLGGNQNLMDITALQNIPSIGIVEIIYSHSLTNLNGIQNITSRLTLVETGITSLSAIGNIPSLDFLGLFYNEQLTDVSTLPENLVLQQASIIGNTMLEDCCTLIPLLENSVDYDLEENGFGCNSLSEIYNYCGIPTNIDLELSLTTSLTEPEYNPGELLYFSLTVKNTGTITAENVRIDIPYTENGGLFIWTTEGISFLGEQTRWEIPSIPANDSLSLTIGYFMPSDNSDFNLYAQVVAADQEDVDSTPENGDGISPNEDDETVISLTAVIYDGLPDLLDDTYYYNLQIYTGSVFPYNVSVLNNGDGQSTPFTGMIYISEDHILDGNDLVLSEFTMDAVSVQLYQDANPNITFPEDILPGNYHIITVLDTENVVEEANEDNNIRAIPVEVVESTPENSVDIELDLSSSSTNYFIYQEITYTLTVTNNSDQKARNVHVDFTIPDGVAFVDGYPIPYDDLTSNIRIHTLFPETTRTYEVTVFTLIDDAPLTCFAQVVGSRQMDMDSTPGNAIGQTATEDDEAVVTIMPYNNAIAEAGNRGETSEYELVDKNKMHATITSEPLLYPNPADTYTFVSWESSQRAEGVLQITNLMGRVVHQEKIVSDKGKNEKRIDLTSLAPGIYMLVFKAGARPHTTRLVLSR